MDLNREKEREREREKERERKREREREAERKMDGYLSSLVEAALRSAAPVRWSIHVRVGNLPSQ